MTLTLTPSHAARMRAVELMDEITAAWPDKATRSVAAQVAHDTADLVLAHVWTCGCGHHVNVIEPCLRMDRIATHAARCTDR